MTWEEVRDLPPEGTVAILPVGAVEAHGPHLPLGTDGIIAMGMAREGALRLAAAGRPAVILPEFPFTAAPFAAGFPGTLSLDPDAVTHILVAMGRAVAARGFPVLALANAHLDPTHLASLHGVARRLEDEGIPVAFPDLTRRALASRLTPEFRSGACHAGRFEGSIVLAERPGWVREDRMRDLRPNPVSLSTAIREGKRTFGEAGGGEAYFGFPAEATAEEGRATLAALGEILAEAVLERMGRAEQAEQAEQEERHG
jgi:creatinine amidohydrolase